jgi:hypothetical protein
MPQIPGILTEAWWDWVFINYRTTILTLGGLAAGVTAITRSTVDDKVLKVIRSVLPWNGPPGGTK